MRPISPTPWTCNPEEGDAAVITDAHGLDIAWVHRWPDGPVMAASHFMLEALKEALPVLEEWAEMQQGYGSFPGGDPRHFRPDEEGTTTEERAAWEAACAAAKKDEAARQLVPAHGWVPAVEAKNALADGSADSATISGGVAHINRVMFGLGTYWSPAAEALVKRAREALAKAGVSMAEHTSSFDHGSHE